MSADNTNDTKVIIPTTPINITTTRGRRSSTVSSMPVLSNSPTSPLPASIQTPASAFSQLMATHSRGGTNDDSAKGGPSGSPTSPLAYFLGAASPKFKGDSANGSFFGGSVVTAIDEDEDSGPPGGGAIGLFGVGNHTRRASWAQNPVSIAPTQPANDRGTSVLRRLSLSSPFQRPTFNLPSAPPSAKTPPRRSPPLVQQPRGQSLQRAATIGVSPPVKKRAISPMGERLLKGHFDGF
ncbi:hypothetical protein FRB96_004874 [Tulasnella sp. 330]|nr:hypothetical protein FRB96_004874 [Tulasnella sp. 330]KAG8885435.1 hypothetical protein FRB97_001158 [Tulasnella sp. 331]KAG8890068.1 hypothetical protein FRB98_001181 [Tulasnella sp. 332]